MPKYKGKDVKVGDVIEVPASARVVTINKGNIAAIPTATPAVVNVEVDAEKAPVPPSAPASATATATTTAPTK